MLQRPGHGSRAGILCGLAALPLLACGLERDWAAFQAAFASDGGSSDAGSSDAGSTTGASADSEGPGGTTGGTSTGSPGGASTEGGADAGASSGTTGTADTSTAGTGEPPAVCGDGVVAGDEECDDGNDEPTDLCDNDCARAWTVFVTSAWYDGKINGLVGTGNRCRNAAAVAKLPRSETYVALISDSTMDAADRLHHARGYYRLVNGLPVAHGWDGLMYGTLENPINVTELSTTLVTEVWTGSLPGGIAVPGAEHCEDWTTNSLFVNGHMGHSSEVDALWIHEPDPNFSPTTCGVTSMSLYCVEQP